MGRSVSYLNNAEIVLYFPIENEYNEDGEFDEDLSQINWDDMILNLTCEIKAKLPSYSECDEWDNRETRIFLQNNLCNIGISEYCGLVSLSVAPRENSYSEHWVREQFSVYHANRIKNTLQKILDDLGLNRLKKIGTFSNGEAVFESV